MKNFFISYNKADTRWAEWVAWQLEDAGYSTILQNWDFQAGSNFVLQMHQAATDAERTIAVLSSNYLRARFTQPEWAAAFAQDPTGESGKLLPVRVEDCELEGLLLPIVYIDLIGKTESEAKHYLLDHVKRVRAKPKNPPGFPSATTFSIPRPDTYPGFNVAERNNAAVFREMLHRFSVLCLYLLSLAAFLWGIIRLPVPLENLLGRPASGLALVLAGVPLWATIGFDAVPKLLRHWRRRQLIENGVRGELTDSSYFRIYPYDETGPDQQRYARADKAQEDVLLWLSQTDEKALYLSGRSGSGKSSLLNAFVIPKLREDSRFMPIKLRGFYDPVVAIHKTLLKPALIWEKPPFQMTDTQLLLEKACEHLGSQRLLLIFDQFEELLILHDRAPERLRAFRELLFSIIADNLPKLTILIVIRSDYLGQLQELGLPAMTQTQNWKEISAFTEKASRDFLNNSGLQIGETLMDEIISQAGQIEETRGLIRPITLNMLGMIIDRITFARVRGLSRRRGVGALLIEYIRASINVSEVRDCARTILGEMITPAGTKRPRLVADLSRETKIDANAITGCLLVLSNYGLVRRIDEQDNVWEVSHDFVARLLSHVLSSWRKAFARKLRPWVAPVSMILWIGVIVLLMLAYLAHREQQARGAILQRQGAVVDVPGGVQVSFAADDKDLGAALDSLAFISNLQELDLSETKVSDAELVHINKLTSLKVLNLDKTGISGEGLKNISALRDLQELSLIETKVNSGGLTYLRNLTNLKKLFLDSDQIDDSGLEHLSDLVNLELLSLSQTRIQQDGLKRLNALLKLQKLYLNETNLNDTGLAYLSVLKKLRELNLESTQITNSGLAVVKEFKKLQELNVSDTSITDEGIKSLSELGELRKLYIVKTQVGDKGLSYTSGLTNLRELNISYTNVTGVGLEHLTRMTGLRELWAKQTKITDVGLENLAQITSLEILSLPNNEITDRGLENIRGLVNLQELYLGGTKMTDAGLRNLQRMGKLRRLYVPVTRITDYGLRELSGLNSIRELRVTDTKVTKQGIDLLKRTLPNLTVD